MTDAGPNAEADIKADIQAEIEKPSAPGLFDIVGSEEKFTGKIVTVRVDQVVMPGGKIAAREVIAHHQAAAVVAVDDQQRVVLVGQYRHPFRRRLWELPAGLLDVAGEDAQTAAARELAEEVGLRAANWQLLIEVTPTPGITDEAIRIYLAQDLSDIGRQGEITDEEADLTIVRIPLRTAVAAVMRGDIVNGAAVAGLLAAHLALTEGTTLRPGNDPWETGPALVRQRGEPLQPPVAL